MSNTLNAILLLMLGIGAAFLAYFAWERVTVDTRMAN